MLAAPRAVAQLAATGGIHLAERLPWARLALLLEKYSQMDWTDACIVALSEMHRQARVITTDKRHFRVYRRFGSKPIPLVAPD